MPVRLSMIKRLSSGGVFTRSFPRVISSSGVTCTRLMSTEKAVLSEKNTQLAKGILSGDRACLARAITLMESSRSDHREQADLLQQYLLSNRRMQPSNWASPSFRIGVAGPPGAGMHCISVGIYCIYSV